MEKNWKKLTLTSFPDVKAKHSFPATRLHLKNFTLILVYIRKIYNNYVNNTLLKDIILLNSQILFLLNHKLIQINSKSKHN